MERAGAGSAVEDDLAVRGGVLTVCGGHEVAVATREGLVGDDLESLEEFVRGKLRRAAEEERLARSHSEELRIQAMRQIVTFLRPERGARAGGSE